MFFFRQGSCSEVRPTGKLVFIGNWLMFLYDNWNIYFVMSIFITINMYYRVKYKLNLSLKV